MFRQISAISRRAFSTGIFDKVPMGPPDAILGLNVAFKNDPATNKLNLGVGAYRDDNGNPFILQCVREAERRIIDSKPDHEYGPIDGLPKFKEVAAKLAFGADSPIIKNNLLASGQALSGTGALRLAGDFLKRFAGERSIYLPIPSWANHQNIFTDSGLKIQRYRYYDSGTCGLDIKGLLTDLKNAPAKQIVLLHACAHNPTGVDPSAEQWKDISRCLKDREHFVLLDLAYQGFATGDPERDATALLTLVNDGHNVMTCQSFAKNFGLYGERIGLWSQVCKDTNERERIESQFKILVRPMYSNPPVYGARVIATVLGDPELAKLWRTEVKLMADRIKSMRTALEGSLKKCGSTRDWSHISKQIGMFCYTGLSEAQVQRLTKDHHIYLTKDGRISMAGVTSKNVDQLAAAIHSVTTS